MKAQPLISIIHFNDVYDIQPKGDLGGIVNFKAKVQQLREQHPNSLLLFSGDCLSPSILSNLFKGNQMVHALNQLKIDVACFGNHEFDYPHDEAVKMSRQCDFPWLMGNIKFTETNELLGFGKQYHIIERAGLKIGVYGVAGQDWIGILAEFAEGELTYYDHVEHSNNMCKHLKQQQNCDLIIALTHMRNQPDIDYPLEVKGVDIVLGGHDHVILEKVVDKTPVIKSGCNFRNVGLIHVYKKHPQRTFTDPHIAEGRFYDFEFHILQVGKAPAQRIDKQLELYVDDRMQAYKNSDQIIGFTQIDLETRFAIHRTQETAYGNFVADLMRLYTESDVGFAHAGTIRNDCILPAGPLKYSQISNIINDALVVKAMSGKILLRTLEYSIEGLPGSYKGSFLHVSGLTFKYNSNLSPGKRILEIIVNGYKFDIQRTYSVTFPSYISHGGDGYDFLRDLPVIKDEIQTTSLLSLILKFFSTLNEQLKKQLQIGEQLEVSDMPLLRKKSSKIHDRITSLQSRLVKGEDGKIYVSIKPQLQRRIVDIQEEAKQMVQKQHKELMVNGKQTSADSIKGTSQHKNEQ